MPITKKQDTLTWSRAGGWPGGTVSALACQDNTVLAATLVGLFVSPDGGMSWTWTPLGAESGAVTAVCCAPSGSVMFAATASARLFRSDDGGAKWRELSTWAGLAVISDLVASPDYASSRTLFASTEDGLFRSFDAGATWQRADFGMLDTDILCVRCAPNFAESEMLLAASAAGGLYRSRNAARAWRESGAGLPDAPIGALAISPAYAQDPTAWVGLEHGGVYVSHDGAQTWASLGLSGETINALCTAADGALWAATSSGVSVLAPGAKAWRTALTASDAALGVCVTHGGRILAGFASSGVMGADDAASAWQAANDGLCARVTLGACTAGGGGLALLTLGAFARAGRDLKAWSVVDEWDPSDSDADAIYKIEALGGARNATILGDKRDGLHLYEAGASAPKRLSPALDADVAFVGSAVHPSLPRLVAVAYGNRMFISLNQGADWREITAPPDSRPGMRMVITHDGALHWISRVVHETDGNLVHEIALWRCEQIGVWDGRAVTAADWVLLTTLKNVRVPLVSVASSAQALFVGAENSMTRIAADARTGKLRPRLHEFPEDEQVTAMFRDGDMLLAATSRGIRASRDDGRTWGRADAGLNGQPVVAFVRDGRGLCAVTIGGTIWRATAE